MMGSEQLAMSKRTMLKSATGVFGLHTQYSNRNAFLFKRFESMSENEKKLPNIKENQNADGGQTEPKMVYITKNKIAMRIVYWMHTAEIKRFSFILKGFHRCGFGVFFSCFEPGWLWLWLLLHFSSLAFVRFGLDIVYFSPFGHLFVSGVTLSLIFLLRSFYSFRSHSMGNEAWSRLVLLLMMLCAL